MGWLGKGVAAAWLRTFVVSLELKVVSIYCFYLIQDLEKRYGGTLFLYILLERHSLFYTIKKKLSLERKKEEN